MPLISGGSGGGGGAITSLFSSTLAAPAASFDITGISSAFSVLELFAILRVDSADAFVGNSLVRFNGDSAGNYSWQYLRGSSATASAAINDATTSALGPMEADANVAASVFGVGKLTIPFYANTATFKSAQAEGGALGGTTNDDSRYVASLWRSTATITRITILPGAGSNFVAGSAVALYGRT